MLFKNFDFDNADAIKAFTLNKDDFSPTWEYYYSVYNYTIGKLLDRGLKENYELNCRARALLFLLRHSFELCLKYNLQIQGKSIPLSHNFDELLSLVKDTIPKEAVEVFKRIDFDYDGSCFRYYSNMQTGNPYFTYKDRLELCDILNTYERINHSDKFVTQKILDRIECNRKNTWDLTFHLGECRNLRHVRTQYDMTLEYLIDGILIDNFEFDNTFLPLLFLMRHSIELALKTNIFELQTFSSEIKQKDYSFEHSLMTLYNCYVDYLSKIEIQQLPNNLKDELKSFRQNFDILNSAIHQLDSNSRFFRFPIDKKGNLHKLNVDRINIIEMLKLYYFTDPFITFTNAVLEEQKLLK